MKELVLCETCNGNGSYLKEIENRQLIYVICSVCKGDCYIEMEVEVDND